MSTNLQIDVMIEASSDPETTSKGKNSKNNSIKLKAEQPPILTPSKIAPYGLLSFSFDKPVALPNGIMNWNNTNDGVNTFDF